MIHLDPRTIAVDDRDLEATRREPRQRTDQRRRTPLRHDDLDDAGEMSGQARHAALVPAPLVFGDQLGQRLDQSGAILADRHENQNPGHRSPPASHTASIHSHPDGFLEKIAWSSKNPATCPVAAALTLYISRNPLPRETRCVLDASGRFFSGPRRHLPVTHGLPSGPIRRSHQGRAAALPWKSAQRARTPRARTARWALG